jgi:DMATS type aromatic prenyltransferase
LNPSQLPHPERSTSTEWEAIFQPYLAAALQHHGEYTPSAIEQHLEFFTTHVIPWMGLGPSPDPTTGALVPPYPSSLTNDHTPFELSCCWKGSKQNGRAVVRYVVDVIPSTAEISRLAALREALRVMGTLEDLSQKHTRKEEKFSLYAFPSLWWQVTRKMIENEQQTHVQPCTRCSPSGVFVAFDLVASAAFGKAYWLFPACQKTSTLLTSVEDTLRTTVETEPAMFPILLENWAMVAAHMTANQDILQPRMLSIDATKYPVPRVKVYARRIFLTSNKFSDIEPHLSLGGRIPLPGPFRQACERLWTSLVGPEDSVPGKGPKYSLVLYDIPTGAPGEAPGKEVSAKLYIMCQEIPRVDSFIARKLYHNCPLLQDSELIKYVHLCSLC